MHTMKNNLLVPTAGIDESNANGYYILWPKEPAQTAKKLHSWLKKTYGLKNCGVIIIDSHSLLLRRGVVGVSLAHHGFLPLQDYRQGADLFGDKLTITQLNIVDSLAAAAKLTIGEGAEGTPLALISDVPFVRLSEKPLPIEKPYSSLKVAEDEDIYAPLLKSAPWKKGGGGVKFPKKLTKIWF